MLLTIDKILLATDLSKNADHALRYGLSIAKKQNAKVHVLHVSEPLSLDAMVTFNMFIVDEEDREKAIASRHEAMKDALKVNQKEFLSSLTEEEKEAYGLVDSAQLMDGHPVDVILNRAKKLNATMIIMGSNEHSTSRTFLGSVALGVLRRSSIPVLIVPPEIDK